MLDKQTLEKLSSFLNTGGKKYLYYHRDQDGVCSAALLSKFYPGFRAVAKRGPNFSDEAMRIMVDNSPAVMVFLDLPVDQDAKSLRKFQKRVPSARIVIIDHHLYEKDMNSESIVHINPLFKSRVYQSASYLVYNILKKLHGNDVKRFAWMAMIGAIGDYDLSGSRDLEKECRKNFPHLLGKDPKNSELAKASGLLGAAITLKAWKGADEALKILTKAEKYEDFSSVTSFRKYKEEVDEEFKRTIEKAQKEEFPEYNLLIFRIETDLSLVSRTANFLSDKNHNKIIIVRKKSNSQWKFSVRYQAGKINLGELVKKAIGGIGAGGGHPRAAAGITKKWKVFREKFLKEIKEAS